MKHRAAGAGAHRFLRNYDARRSRQQRRQRVHTCFHLGGQVAGEQQEFLDAEADELPQQPGQERPVAAGQDRLRRVRRQRAEPRAEAAHQDGALADGDAAHLVLRRRLAAGAHLVDTSCHPFPAPRTASRRTRCDRPPAAPGATKPAAGRQACDSCPPLAGPATTDAISVRRPASCRPSPAHPPPRLPRRLTGPRRRSDRRRSPRARQPPSPRPRNCRTRPSPVQSLADPT